MAEKLPVFVYGTLRPHDYNWKIYLEGRVEQVFSAALAGHKLYYQDFPFIIETNGATVVSGELIFVGAANYDIVLENLDSLEEYDPETDSGWYLRVARQVDYINAGGQAQKTTAWVYEGGPQFIQNLRQATLISHGDWLKFRAENHKKSE